MLIDKHFTPGPPERYRPGDVVHGYLLLRRVAGSIPGDMTWSVRDRTGTERLMRVTSPQSVDDDLFLRWVGLRHPNLLTALDWFLGTNDRLHLVTEPGEQLLTEVLHQSKPDGCRGIGRETLLPLIRDAADALDHLHQNGSVHTAVTPDAISIVGGRARVTLGVPPRAAVAPPGLQSVAAGNPKYMAPEVWSGRVDPAADQYSLALTYAELRQGRTPVVPAPIAEVMLAHLDGRYEFVPDVFTGDELTAVRRALSTQPQQRFETCSDFVRAIG